MTTYDAAARSSTTGDAWAESGAIFAASLMIMVGIFEAFEGLAALIKQHFYVVAPNYAFKVDITAYGWIHLIWGIVLVLAGIFLFRASGWARFFAIAVAVLSAIANFLSIPYYPFWALTIIAMDIWVIWALAFRWGSARL